MKIAVITPYYKEPTDMLQLCHQSVVDQDLKADHFFVADGHPNPFIRERSVEHVILPRPSDDNGNTPRGVGGILAINRGYDFIAYLDADNWFHKGHLSSLIELHRTTKAGVCASFRTIHAIDGSELPNVQDPEEANLTHIDTSCYMLHRSAFELNDIWLKMPKPLSPICDRVFLKGVITKRFTIVSTRAKTVAFRSQYEDHYRAANLTPPTNAKRNIIKPCVEYLKTVEGLRHTVEKLGFFPL